MDEKTEVKGLIETSFLSKEQKRELEELLEGKGPSDSFYEAFNVALIEAVDLKVTSLEKVLNEYKSICDGLEDVFINKKEKLEKKLEHEMKNIDSPDIVRKKKILDDYYQSLQNLRAEYEKELKEKNANFLLPFYKLSENESM